MAINLNTVIYLVAAILILIILFVLLRKFRGKKNVKNQIYVGNLAYRVNENDLKTFFGEYGSVEEAYVVKHPRTRRSKGYAFVKFAKSNSAADALVAHGQQMFGRTIVVRLAKPRTDD